MLVANKIFHVIVVLLIYFCDKFVASEIHHSRRHCNVCDDGKILIKSLYLKWYIGKRLTYEFLEKKLDKVWC